MDTKGVHLWFVGLLALASSTGCLDAIVGEAAVCTYAGKGYEAGDAFAASDGCNTCSCAADGSIACTDAACAQDAGRTQPATDSGPASAGRCTYAGRTYEAGDRFPHVDGCNSCSCDANSTTTCTLLACTRDAAAGMIDPGNPMTATCMHGGRAYKPGESFPADDGCNTCSCERGQVACTDRACPRGCSYGGKTYSNGATFPAADGCNTCDCNDGAVSCDETGCGGGATCTFNGRTYKEGEGFYDSLRCNGCTCSSSGTVSCTARACDPSAACSFGKAQFASGNQVVCPDGCNSCLCVDRAWTNTDAACAALARIEVCQATQQDRIRADVLYQTAHVLALEVSQLACMTSAPKYKLCWDGQFLESSPVQTRLYVVPTEPSSCMEVQTQQTVFDLTPLRDAYRMAYQTTSGTIDMSIYGTTQNYTF